MNVTNQPWNIRKFHKIKDTIDPNPPFQRGEVWRLETKQLLLDSILCGFDIPKIYLHDMGDQPIHRYAVADGQQRLKAIWGYLEGGFALTTTSYVPDATWTEKKFAQLTTDERQRVLNTKLVTAVIEGTVDEVRELFWRLQQGSQLNPAEKRNCMASQLGDIVRMMAENHALFRSGVPALLSADRRRRDDMCAHAFAIEVNKSSQDLKAPNIRALYERFRSDVPHGIRIKVNHTLTFMSQMTAASPGCISRKWGFADLYRVISEHGAELPTPAELSRRFLAFEQRRLQFNAEPEVLIAGARMSRANRNLYDYIIAFKTSGAEADNLEKRYSVLAQELLA